jgi:hypothetical protein
MWTKTIRNADFGEVDPAPQRNSQPQGGRLSQHREIASAERRAFDWKAAVLVKREPLSGRHGPISIPQLRYRLKAMAMQQCSAGANYSRGNWREIARGADIAAALHSDWRLADWLFAIATPGCDQPFSGNPSSTIRSM